MPIPSFRHLADDDLPLPTEVEELGGRILGAARQVSREIGHGMAERIYEQALEIVLEDEGIPVHRQAPIEVLFRGRNLGEGRRLDLLVDRRVAVEVKSAAEMHPTFETQRLTYMRGLNVSLGFVINFGMPTLSAGIRRKVISR